MECIAIYFLNPSSGYMLIWNQRDTNYVPGVQCASCDAGLGIDDQSSGSLKFFRWSLCLRSSEGAAWEEDKVQSLISARILDLISSQAVHRFVAYSSDVGYAVRGIMVRSTIFAPQNLLIDETALGTVTKRYILGDCSTV